MTSWSDRENALELLQQAVATRNYQATHALFSEKHGPHYADDVMAGLWEVRRCQHGLPIAGYCPRCGA